MRRLKMPRVSLSSNHKKRLNIIAAMIVFLGSSISPLGFQSHVYAAEATASDLSFEQSNYGTLVTSGYIENPVLGSSTTGASASWGYSAGTYYRYAKSIESTFAVPTPNTTGDSEYYLVVEATTSTSGFGGNGVTSFYNTIGVSANGGTDYYDIWQNSLGAIGNRNYSVSTEYRVIKINGSSSTNRTNAQGQRVDLTEMNNTNMTNIRMKWSWGTGGYESMKSLKYRLYRTSISKTSAPPIIVTPSESYHKGYSNTFVLEKPSMISNWQESEYGVLQYRLNGIGDSSWQDYHTGDAIPIPFEGEVKIESRLLTRGAMESLYGLAYSRQDNQPPTVPTVSNLDSTAWYKSFDLSISPGTDTGSGVAGVDYSLSGATVQAKQRVTGIIPIRNQGTTFIYASTIDNVGFASNEIVRSVKIDSIAPSPSLTMNQDWAKTVTITATGLDAVSGMKSITLPDGTVKTGSTVDYIITKNGTYTFTFTDRAGNVAQKSINVTTIDNILPILTVSLPSLSWTDQPANVVLNFQDNESGLDINRLYYKWSLSQDTPSDFNQAFPTQSLIQKNEGIWYLHLRAYDLADNKADKVFGPYQLQQIAKAPNLQVMGQSTTSMKLTWSLPDGDAETDSLVYIIQNQGTGKSWTLPYPTNEFVDTDLKEGTNYDYAITAKNHVGESITNSIVRGITLPAVTTKAKVYASSDSYRDARIDIDTVTGASSYRVIATNLSTKKIDIDTTVTGNTYQLVSGLSPYTFYDFAISAVNASGQGAPYHVSFLSLPDQVQGFKSVELKEKSITLTWDIMTRPVYDFSTVTEDTYYQLRRDNQVLYEGSNLMFEDQGLMSGTEYNYDISAGNSTGFGTRFTLSGVWTLPAAPTRLEQIHATDDSFDVMVDIPRGTTGFQSIIDGVVKDMGTPKSKYSFNGYSAGTTHRIEFVPYNSSGFGASITSLVTTLPPIPDANVIQVVSIHEDAVVFDIKGLKGATKYKVVIDGQTYIVGEGQFTVYGLHGGTHYTYQFAGGNAEGYGALYEASVLTLPSQPTDYRVVKDTATTIALQWADVKGASSYQVLSNNGTLIDEVSTPNYTIRGLQAGDAYDFVIQAKNESGIGKSSMFKWRTRPGYDVTDTAIDYDKMVSVDTIGIHDMTMHWPSIPGADSYDIYDNLGQFVVKTDATMITLTQLSSASLFSKYYVVPTNSTGEGHSMLVSDFVTLPDDTITLRYDSTRSTIAVQLQHNLTNEILVITSQDEMLYRGPIKDYHLYTQERLQADSTYTFVVWTENEKGDKSKDLMIETRTNKELDHSVQVPPVLTPTSPVTDPVIGNDPTPASNSNEKPTKKEFVDIDRSFAKESITRLADLGIVQGISDDLYAPQAGTTRAEFMAMLTRLSLSSEQMKAADTQKLTFKDINADDWYILELKAATKFGIAKGFNDAVFGPDMPIDREQAAKMLSGALYSLIAETKGNTYIDNAKISDWAKKEVDGLTATAIIKGYPDQTFRPHAKLTRAESAAMIDRAMTEGSLSKR